jgi:hypothetical protein
VTNQDHEFPDLLEHLSSLLDIMTRHFPNGKNTILVSRIKNGSVKESGYDDYNVHFQILLQFLSHVESGSNQ